MVKPGQQLHLTHDLLCSCFIHRVQPDAFDGILLVVEQVSHFAHIAKGTFSNPKLNPELLLQAGLALTRWSSHLKRQDIKPIAFGKDGEHTKGGGAGGGLGDRGLGMVLWGRDSLSQGCSNRAAADHLYIRISNNAKTRDHRFGFTCFVHLGPSSVRGNLARMVEGFLEC